MKVYAEYELTYQQVIRDDVKAMFRDCRLIKYAKEYATENVRDWL